MKRTLLILSILALSLRASAQYEANWESIDQRPVPTWFEDAKFGIFIHWGIYAVPSYSPNASETKAVWDCYAEHYWNRLSNGATEFKDFHKRVYGDDTKYQDFVHQFKAEMFKPEQWAEIFKDAGAQYVVLTSKHHEGFCLWPSKYSWNWNAMDMGPHRDLLGDLTTAVRQAGLKMGYYYSLLEWFHPDYNKERLEKYVDNHMIPQMKELVTKYNPDLVWTDGEWDHPSEKFKSVEFLQWLFNESSVKETVVVNDRWGSETRGKHGGFYTTEYESFDENNSTHTVFARPWEECRGISHSFGFNRNEQLADYADGDELVHLLINKVSRGGNLLLNVGPTADGRIPVIMQQRLKELGDWLRVNGEAIYGTRKWDKAPAITNTTTQFYTKKENALYVLTTEWTDKAIKVEGIDQVKKVTMLGYKGHIDYKLKNNKLTIQPAAIHTPADIPCQHAWVYKIELK